MADSWVELNRRLLLRKQSQLEVLGLVVSLSPDGEIKIVIPMKKWQQRLTVRAQMKAMGLPNNQGGFFIVVLNFHINTDLRYALLYP